MRTLILCLGNDLLADDAFGFLVAQRLDQLSLEGVKVTATCESGLQLLDHILDCSRLIVVDALLSGSAKVGTIHVLHEKDLRFSAAGFSPHYVGLFETVALGRRLHLPMPGETLLLVVEASDCLTVGGSMHPAVQAAVPRAVELVRQLIHPQSVAQPAPVPQIQLKLNGG